MNHSAVARRVNAKSLRQNVDQPVRIVGKCTSVADDEYVLESDGSINIHCSAGVATLENGAWYEIIGKCLDDHTVMAYIVLKSDKELDPSLVNAIVVAEDDHSTLF